MKQRNFQLTLKRKEADTTDIPLPKISYDTHIELGDLKQFKKNMIQIKKMSDYVTIQSSGQNIEFSGTGDSGECKILYSRDDENVEDICSKEDSESTYDLGYIIYHF